MKPDVKGPSPMLRVIRMSLVAVAVAGSIVVALRRSGAWERLTSWGVDPTVSATVLPGDDLVLDPAAVDTRSLEIAAPPQAIWPWLVQMDDERAGEYTYSAFGLPHRKGTDHIVPEWQDLGQKAWPRDKTRNSQPNERLIFKRFERCGSRVPRTMGRAATPRSWCGSGA